MTPVIPPEALDSIASDGAGSLRIHLILKSILVLSNACGGIEIGGAEKAHATMIRSSTMRSKEKGPRKADLCFSLYRFRIPNSA